MFLQELQPNLALISKFLTAQTCPINFTAVTPHYFSTLSQLLELSQKSLSDEFDCLLVDITDTSDEVLEDLNRIDLSIPIVALIDGRKPLPPCIELGNIFSDVLAMSELTTALGAHRLKQTIKQYKSPLALNALNNPLISIFQDIVDQVSDWIIVKDLDHRFVFVTNTFANAVGLPMNEIIGKNDLEIGSSKEEVFGDPKTGWRGFWAQDDEVTNSGLATTEDNPTWRTFSAAPRHKRTLRIPLKNANGVIFGLLVCSQDITEQKQNERMLRDRTEMLSRVTQEKQNAEKHRLAAEQAVTTKNKFLAAASHDLRQPLHAMGLFLDVLESRMNEQDDLELMKKLKQSTVSLNRLFNSLLDISRLDAGVVEPQKDHFPAARLFDNLCEDFRHQAAEKQLQFIGQSDDAVLFSDFVLVSRIIRNLVVNAIDNTHVGSVSLTCQMNVAEKHIVSVTDTGPGIPADEHARIFEEFHQISTDRGQVGKGIGLGLAIVKRLCELLDIDISIESTVGKGTCFVLNIPAGNSVDVVSETHKKHSLSLRGLTILVLDDDKNIREGMEALLQVYGCATYSAGSLDEVFENLSQSAQIPDLIMADYELGLDVTGDKMVETLRKELGIHIPAVLITGDTSIAPERSAAIGDLPVVHKPIKPEEMVAVIAELVSSKSRNPALRH